MFGKCHRVPRVLAPLLLLPVFPFSHALVLKLLLLFFGCVPWIKGRPGEDAKFWELYYHCYENMCPSLHVTKVSKSPGCQQEISWNVFSYSETIDHQWCKIIGARFKRAVARFQQWWRNFLVKYGLWLKGSLVPTLNSVLVACWLGQEICFLYRNLESSILKNWSLFHLFLGSCGAQHYFHPSGNCLWQCCCYFW